MKNKKFVLITSDHEEDNIGVLDIGTFETVIQKDAEKIVTKRISEKLPSALSSHFDDDVELGKIELESLYPITGKVTTKIGDLEYEININETWVY